MAPRSNACMIDLNLQNECILIPYMHGPFVCTSGTNIAQSLGMNAITLYYENKKHSRAEAFDFSTSYEIIIMNIFIWVLFVQL